MLDGELGGGLDGELEGGLDGELVLVVSMN